MKEIENQPRIKDFDLECNFYLYPTCIHNEWVLCNKTVAGLLNRWPISRNFLTCSVHKGLGMSSSNKIIDQDMPEVAPTKQNVI